MKRKRLREKLKRIAKIHAWVSGGLFVLYIGLSAVYSPEFLLSDIRDKFRALADDTIVITARVLGPPVKPVVTATPYCNTSTGTLSVILDWADDENTETFDVTRDTLPLVSGLTASTYSDTAVSVGTTYVYEVTANGPMGPGFAISDPISATTPSECVIAFTPTLSIVSFGGRSVESYSGTPAVSDRKPVFSGTTNIPNAVIDILVNGSNVVSAVTYANANGYWSWEPPISLPRGDQTIFVTATDPNDPSISVSENLAFRITRKSDDGGTKDIVSLPATGEPTSPAVPTPSVEPDEPAAAPFDMSLSLLSDQVYQGRTLPFSVGIRNVDPDFVGMDAIARYTVLDVDGRERFSFFENIVITEGKIMNVEAAIPPYFKDGRYRIKAEILFDRYDVSRDRIFTVMPLPMLSVGGGFVLTYADFLSRLGTISLLLLLLLLLWIFVFSREYMLYLRALRHITERHLARAGFFGNGKGVSY